MVSRRRFLVWLVVLVGVWCFANWPTSGGALKSWSRHAGFPLVFVAWDGVQMVRFDWPSLAADVGALLALVPVAWLCAWSRPRCSPPPTKPTHDELVRPETPPPSSFPIEPRP